MQRVRSRWQESSTCRSLDPIAEASSCLPRCSNVEEVVDDFGPRSANAVILPAWTVTAIAVVPGGAWPSYAHGYYKRANAFYKAWDAIARDRDTFQAWMRENVIGKGPDAFAAYAGRRAA